ncbi:malto-oligosyltrehalose trehalohydrolase [Candidatus Bathycorpusculum sp.]|uniref:malto-oligosyltrehalose trehalohydrolase n=1 Tax=Candidatus Bathycorpusculum sp. TaxID=2994959 RepID=UPI00282A449C|nr:malto-oligosyltrehalose trehalohydrolase [Candidatus Termitimicrobium sp.]MCL2431346.1 malto-oligosyltrehalose trehalohydrolase [Candidatus Termitimicrobium sp.]
MKNFEDTSLHVGADFQNGTCRFIVWAPNQHHLTLVLPEENQRFSMDKSGDGYWIYTLDGLKAGTRYLYELDDKTQKPDPASHYQSEGVFGASQVIDHDAFCWSDQKWRGLGLKDLIFYELHVGTFTPAGTLKAIQGRIKELHELGINAVELMPITQFSGIRNWGYDSVFPYAVHNSYGKPDDLKALVNECHNHGVALFMDCVYNHLGPEGSCLNSYGPYFPSTRIGRWGASVNLDGPQNEGVRNYFLENLIHWLSRYHLDGIRLDAVLSMHDKRSPHFLAELNKKVYGYAKTVIRKTYLIAESGYNIPQVLTPINRGGFGFDAQWLDDFQHALFALLTGEREGYYNGYGSVQDLAETLTDGFVFVGDEPNYKRKRPDESYSWIPADQFIVFSQNHDQVGNRLLGDRLTALSGFEAAKLAAGVILLSPYVPLLFMGEEYGETAPFQFFIDYQSNELAESVRAGRKREFALFHWQGEVPDPQNIQTFEKSKLNWQTRNTEQGQKILSYYRALIKLRKKHPIFQPQTKRQIKCIRTKAQVLFVHKQSHNAEAVIIANCAKTPVRCDFPLEDGTYVKVLDSSDFVYDDLGPTLPTFTIKDGYTHTLSAFNLVVLLKKSQGDKLVD